MEKIKAGVCKYPKEVYSALTSTKTFSVDAELFPAMAKKGESPYKVYDNSFSRLVLTIVNKTKGKPVTFPKANISAFEVPALVENSRAAKSADAFLALPFIKQIFVLLKESVGLIKKCGNAVNTVYTFITTGKKPVVKQENTQYAGTFAKTVKINNGNYKGKTPFEILIEDPNQVEGLQKQYAWLQQNLEKYPKNKEQMEAINEAIYMLNNGLLKSDNGESIEASSLELGDVVLYEAMPKALIRKQDDKGLCPVYEIGIVWHIGDKYPVEIVIKNYKAPIQRAENGAINPLRKDAVEYVSNNYRLSASQWFECLYGIQTHMRRFEDLYAEMQLRQAKEADDANRAQASNNAQ